MWKFALALLGFLCAQRVLSYDLWMDSVAFSAQNWYWRAGVRIDPQSASILRLELRNYTIDSVWWQGGPLSYIYTQDSLLSMILPMGISFGDTVWIAYRGSGVQDPGGFGGMYWGPLHVFNIGVSLYIQRHSYGRAWHPVVDSFGIKVPYKFHVRIPDTLKAACNGVLDSVQSLGGGWARWHWRRDEAIPAYLASVAIGRYAIAKDSLIRAPGDTLSIWYFVNPADSAGVYGTFARLKAVIRNWEAKLGRYPYDRVGYVGVAFSSGAMEHSTNIAYPAIIMNGTQMYDWLWAHELMHEWFGNAVTGPNEREIWLKEAFATYGEALFYEQFFGRGRYYDHLRNYLDIALREVRWEEGLFPLSDIPLEHTYGSVTYRKGATVVHSLRHQIGDSLFFLGLRAYQNHYRHRVANTDSLLQVLIDSTGDGTVGAFFQDWVQQPGEVHFRLDSIRQDPQHPDTFWVYWRMRLRDKPTYATPTRLTIYFQGPTPAHEAYRQFFTDGSAQGAARVQVPFSPRVAVLNANGELSDASIHGQRLYKGNTNHNFPQQYLSVRTIGLPSTDSLWVHAALNHVEPYDRGAALLSTTRYWQLDGVWGKSMAMRGIFQYNGRPSGTGAYLDTTWLNFREDSLILYWRPNAGAPWQEWLHYTLDPGTSPTDYRGRIIADSLLPGEYTLGRRDLTTFITQSQPEPPLWIVYGESGLLHLKNASLSGGTYEVYDLLGRRWGEGYLWPGESKEQVLPGGLYLVRVPERTRKVWIWR
jgi:aminopeptidase N